MKEIKRGNYPSIFKQEIDLSHSISYYDLDLEMINQLLNEIIMNYTYSTIDLLQLLKENYQGSLINTIKNIHNYSDVRFNCYYATVLLKEKLKEKGIDTNIISYKSTNFSTSSGDDLIKEAHMALLIPTIRNQKIYYVILDPGLRIPSPIEFYADMDKTIIQIDHDEIIIGKTELEDYPYTMIMKGYNRYSTSQVSYQSQEFFDVRYETINPVDVLFPISYQILNGYRIINYSINKSDWAFVKIMVISGYLECCDNSHHIQIPFWELDQYSRNDLIQILKPFTDKLNINSEELIDIILFVLEHYSEFIKEIIHPNILEESTNSILNLNNKCYVKLKSYL